MGEWFNAPVEVQSDEMHRAKLTISHTLILSFVITFYICILVYPSKPTILICTIGELHCSLSTLLCDVRLGPSCQMWDSFRVVDTVAAVPGKGRCGLRSGTPTPSQDSYPSGSLSSFESVLPASESTSSGKRILSLYTSRAPCR